MKARLAKKCLKRASVLEVREGDVLVVSYPPWADGEMLDLAPLQKLFPRNKVIAMPNDMSITALGTTK